MPDFLLLAGRKLRMKCGVYANLRPVPGGAHEGDVKLLCSFWSPIRASLLTYFNKLWRTERYAFFRKIGTNFTNKSGTGHKEASFCIY